MLCADGALVRSSQKKNTMAMMIGSLFAPSLSTMTMTPGRALAGTMPGAEAIPFIGAPGIFDPLGLTPESEEECGRRRLDPTTFT